ncbi:hypothetical protein GCM10011371_01110 [Novosphingobium marinum]|uniref:Uncharacterized protein n=1 Tax=Novosphingobium marinum TaxID=1514948 RepID=A0A7Y9XV40_9SPHN|nr:hypothetical protein [Novosphingobium marinum]NYH93803.1 hypothetical protein [Novosphingobium marinum]GGC17375.1 hypothetical protein GCM10011371_01110 [Novosphingobium marinum]
MEKWNPADRSDGSNKSPEDQTGEKHGSVESPQRSDHNMKDLPRGSQGDIRRKSARR